MKPNAIIMPCELTVHVALVQSEDLVRLNAIQSPVNGLDLSSLNSLSHRTRAVRLSDLKHMVLTQPCTALRLKLDAEEPPALSGTAEVEMCVEHAGMGHALVAWFSAALDEAVEVSTAPGIGEPMRGYSWGQCAHFLPGMSVRAGETLLLTTCWNDKGLSFATRRVRELPQHLRKPESAKPRRSSVTQTAAPAQAEALRSKLSEGKASGKSVTMNIFPISEASAPAMAPL